MRQRRGGGRASKDGLFEGFAAVGKALASGRRLEVLDVLAQGERSVEVIAGELEQSVANTSHHLQTLAGAGLVLGRRRGTRIFYRLAGDEVAVLLATLQAVAAKHVARVDRLAREYLGDRAALERIDRRELAQRLRRGEVTVLDVRPSVEYEAGHVAGARAVPIGELSKRLRDLPKDKEVVAYCRGPYCVYADEAVRLLRDRGFRARRLEDGFPEWKRAGLPVEAGRETA